MNNGFRARPEYVQRMMNPDTARQFAMGGDVLNRPLFRQSGGPAPAMPNLNEEVLAQAEMQGRQIGEEAQVRTMENINAATDVKSAIDALRGNDMPLEARYQELAGLVGEQDAMQTPESVLALTQPAIMMTEQGALDSGIGELMQSLAGDTQMDQGMDEGLGALMMQGAGSTPPENFRQGGPVEVRKFQDGTPPTGNSSAPLTSLDPYLERATAAREGIFGTPEERAARLARAQQQARSDAMFNLANFGLAFAGETQGGSVAERLANAATRSNVVGGFQQAGKDVAASRDLQEQQDMQMRMSALESAEKSLAAQEERAGRIALETLRNENELAKLDVTIGAQIEAATTAFERQKIINKTAQNFEERITNLRLDASALEGEQNRALQERLSNQANALQKELVKLRADADLENNVAMFELTSAFDLEKMEKGQEFEMAKLATMQGYETIAAEKQMAFTAAQNALNRMLTRSEGAKNRSFQEQQNEFNAELQKELKQMGLDDNQVARALQHAQFMISSAQKDHQLQQGDEQLTLNQAIAGVDAQYKADKLALERAAMNVVKLGSEAKSDQIKYITNAERLNQYANGELGDNTTTFEQAILDYMKPTETWDSALGKYVQGKSPDLAPRVKEAIKAGNPAFYNQLFGGGGTPAPKTNDTASKEIPDDDGPIDLAKRAPGLMTADGKVDLNSPLFDRAAPTLFKPTVDYSMAIGASRILPGIGKTVSEGFSELGVGQGTGPEGQNLSQAQKDLTTLANRLFSLTVDKSQNDRMLRAVQERLEKEVEGIRPGGIFLKNDADALAGLKTMADSLALIIEYNAVKVPEFGGNSEGYKTEQVTRARDDIIATVLVLNEVLAFQKQFERNVTGALDRPASDEGVDAATDFLDNLIPQTKVEN